MAEPMSQCLPWGQYFWFFCFVEVKPKKQKNKMAEPMSQCLAWGQYFCFFLVFRGFCNFLVSEMGSAILLFWFFKVFAIFGLSQKTLVSFPKKTFFS